MTLSKVFYIPTPKIYTRNQFIPSKCMYYILIYPIKRIAVRNKNKKKNYGRQDTIINGCLNKLIQFYK